MFLVLLTVVLTVGSGGGTCTRDTAIMSRLLCQAELPRPARSEPTAEIGPYSEPQYGIEP